MKGDAPAGLLLLGKPEKEKSDSGSSDGALSAAKALLKAIKANDASAVSEALSLHYKLCEDDSSMGDDDEE
jgi:hypothetical protein